MPRPWESATWNWRYLKRTWRYTSRRSAPWNCGPVRKTPPACRAVLGSTNQFTVGWQPKSGGSEKAAGLANVTDTIAVNVGDGVVHTQAVFDYQILRGSLGELIAEVPSDQRLLDVQAPGLRDWQTEAAAGRQRVKVRLYAPATETVRLELHTEAPISPQAFWQVRIRLQFEGTLFTDECGGEIVEKALVAENEGLLIRIPNDEIYASKPSYSPLRVDKLQLHVRVGQGHLLAAKCLRSRSIARNQWNGQRAGDRFGHYRVVSARINRARKSPEPLRPWTVRRISGRKMTTGSPVSGADEMIVV